MPRRLAILVSLLTLGASAADAQPDRPRASNRVVQAWDFEDPVSRVEPVPAGWYRAQHRPGERDKPGFPAWNVAAITTASAHSGERSVMLPTRGGSTSLMLSAGVVPALPDTDYAVAAEARTEGLAHARARLSAWLLDENLDRIPGSSAESPLTTTDGRWQRVAVDIRGHPRAAWIQIELLLLQPRFFEPARSGQQVWPEDFNGSVYFDDVRISQVPTVDLSAPSPAGMFIAPASPELLLTVRDQTGEAIEVETEIRDLDGRVLLRERRQAPHAGRTFTWSPRLERFGWYEARATVAAGGALVGQRSIRFGWAPALPEPEPTDRRVFAVVAEDLSGDDLASLPAFLERTLTGSASLSLWPPNPARSDSIAPGPSLSACAEALLSMGMDLTFVFTHIPRTLTRELRIEPDDALGLLLAEGDPWTMPLSRTMAAFGERVRRWQIGRTGGESAASRPDMASRLHEVRAKLRRMIPRPLLVAPWPIVEHSAWAPAALDSVVLSWPAALPAEAIGEGWRATAESVAAADRSLFIELPDAERFGRRAVVVELTRRVVSALAAGARRVAINGPWTAPAGSAGMEPEAHALAWRTLSAFLCGRAIRGVLPAGPGSTVYIADGPGGGILIGWSDSPEEEGGAVAGWLGEGTATAWDPFGNSEPITPDPLRGHVVKLDEMPVFVSGIDANLVMFRAGLAVDPPFLSARAERHEVHVVITNPWSVGITGRLRIAEPVTWTIAPRVIPFSLSAGATARVPVEIAFAPGEEAGRREMIVEAEIAAERRYPLVRWPIPLELGLPTVDLLATYRIEPSADGERSDVVVSLLITNTGAAPLTVSAFARAPGFRAFEAPVSGLAPGESITRRFRFDNGGGRLRGRTVRVGLQETSGTGRLNRNLVIEER